MIPEYYHQIFVGLVVAILILLIYQEKIKASLSFLCAVVVLVAGGVISEKEIIAGLANTQIASIILLIIITTGLRNNFNVEGIFDKLFKNTKTYKSFLFRMMGSVAFLSSFINNTPIVAILTPYIYKWGQNRKIAPSKLLIPLSFATIMGGMLTIIGTSTTLVLNGLLVDNNIIGLNSKHLFIIGLLVVISGIVLITITANFLLPNRQDALSEFNENKREYLVETILKENSPLINKSVLDAGLRNLEGIYLVEIIRNNKIISPVCPEEIILEQDILSFAGDTHKIDEIIKSDLGIQIPKHGSHEVEEKMECIEAVIGNNSVLKGNTAKEIGFRQRYDAAMVAIHRQGKRLSGKIGEIPLEAGDLILLYTGKGFKNKINIYRDLHIVSELNEINNIGKKKSISLLLASLFFVSLVVAGKISLFIGLVFIFLTMAMLKLISTKDIKHSLDLDMIAILVFSLSIGQAIVSSKTGDLIAQKFIEFLIPFGRPVLLVGIMVFTTLLTSIITNVGAASIVFPIAYGISQSLGIDGMPFYLGIAFSASAAFLSPIGYQTNLMVFGPGAYTFKDFIKIGVPVSIVYLAVSSLGIIYLYRDIFY